MDMIYSNPLSGPVVYFNEKVLAHIFGTEKLSPAFRVNVRITESDIFVARSDRGIRILKGQNTTLPFRVIFPKHINGIETLKHTGPLEVGLTFHVGNLYDSVSFRIPTELRPIISKKVSDRKSNRVEPGSLDEFRLVLSRLNALLALHPRIKPEVITGNPPRITARLVWEETFE